MEIISFELSEVDYGNIKYVVMIAEYNSNLVIIKNKIMAIYYKMLDDWMERKDKSTFTSYKIRHDMENEYAF